MGTRSTVKGLCMVNVAWEEQANGPEGAYCRVRYEGGFHYRNSKDNYLIDVLSSI